MLTHDAAGELWRLPITHTPVNNRTNLTASDSNVGQYTILYHNYCATITGAWHTLNPKEWMPQALRKDTPYSFNLLKGLAKLAERTRDSRSHGHELLTAVWLGRKTGIMGLDDASHKNLSLQQDIIAIADDKLFLPEPGVVECPAGLMLIDVRAAIDLANKEATTTRQLELSDITPENAKQVLRELERQDTRVMSMSLLRLWRKRCEKARRVARRVERGGQGMNRDLKRKQRRRMQQAERQMKREKVKDEPQSDGD